MNSNACFLKTTCYNLGLMPRLKNSVKKVTCLGFLDQENVWRRPQFFQSYGKRILIPRVSVRMQPCTVLGLDGIQGSDQFKENNLDFPTDCIFGLQEHYIAQLKQAGVQEFFPVGWQHCCWNVSSFLSVDKSLTAPRNVSPSTCIAFARKLIVQNKSQ